MPIPDAEEPALTFNDSFSLLLKVTKVLPLKTTQNRKWLVERK
jgi:hypothetical protein